MSDVISAVAADGELELLHRATGERFTCGPQGAAMWVALQQHEWRLDATATELSRAWMMDSLRVRVALGRWVEELQIAGLVEEA
ncbi:PqqD family protein [Streptomyces sp. A5-4]|uniref:PqqD family protein n=1 Tax=Streptomyces sp. A5-4 TaxID=3384771 RepID=UPI003DA7C331